MKDYLLEQNNFIYGDNPDNYMVNICYEICPIYNTNDDLLKFCLIQML
jgi:hypothetical protein